LKFLQDPLHLQELEETAQRLQELEMRRIQILVQALEAVAKMMLQLKLKLVTTDVRAARDSRE
jgi:hypothetical protein